MYENEKKWISETAFEEIRKDEKNKYKGLVPRFNPVLSDRFYGGTKQSLGKVCQALAEEGFLFKSFIKFNPSSNDKIEEDTVVEGNHKGMKVGKDGKLSTPIYWLAGDDNIPSWAMNQQNRAANFRSGAEEFKKLAGSETSSEEHLM